MVGNYMVNDTLETEPVVADSRRKAFMLGNESIVAFGSVVLEADSARKLIVGLHRHHVGRRRSVGCIVLALCDSKEV